jgi:hypothetical protein
LKHASGGSEANYLNQRKNQGQSLIPTMGSKHKGQLQCNFQMTGVDHDIAEWDKHSGMCKCKGPIALTHKRADIKSSINMISQSLVVLIYDSFAFLDFHTNCDDTLIRNTRRETLDASSHSQGEIRSKLIL